MGYFHICNSVAIGVDFEVVCKKSSDFLAHREDTVVVVFLIFIRFHVRTSERGLPRVPWLQPNHSTRGFLGEKVSPIFSCLVDVLLLGF